MSLEIWNFARCLYDDRERVVRSASHGSRLVHWRLVAVERRGHLEVRGKAGAQQSSLFEAGESMRRCARKPCSSAAVAGSSAGYTEEGVPLE